MADEPHSAGKRFSEDLRRIREDRGVSVDQVHSETRIAQTLIESFEEGRLYDHPTYNRVYLRSFIKAYADAVAISRETALEGLDAALNGTYQHDLAARYLDEGDASDADPEEAPAEPSPPKDDSPRSSPDGPTAGGPEGRGGIVGPPRAVGEEPAEEAIPTDQPPPETVSDDPATDADQEAPDESDDTSDLPPTANRDQDSAEAPPLEPDEPAASAASDDETKAPGVEDAPEETAADEEESDNEEESDADSSVDAPDLSGPEALRATPDDDDSEGEADDGDDETPSWMAEEGDASDPAETPSPAASSEAGDAPPLGEGTGIVGEPTEMGEGGAASPPSAEADAAPTPPASSDDGILGGDNRRMLITGIGIAVVFLVLVGLGVAYMSSDDEAAPAAPDTVTTAATPAPAPEDTTADTTTTPAPQPPMANVTLGTEISLLVVADSNVSALRIQRDDDLRRPYWIQQGEASLFPFEERAVIGNEFDDIRLFIEGYRYPVAPGDTVDGLEITRERAQAFVDTLRGDPPSLSVETDTIPVGEPTN